ncbi:MAG: hypothetical protein JW811_08170 [Clostridiales bacterium]|nr:hypothetical protein [Clostridiales bacterium]
MTWFWITAASVVLSWGAEVWLSYRESIWHGLILPAVCFVGASVFLIFLLTVFPETEAFGAFLTQYGSAGFFALVLKIGFLYVPAAVHLAIYFVCKHYYRKNHHPAKHNKEYKKMLADDL